MDVRAVEEHGQDLKKPGRRSIMKSAVSVPEAGTRAEPKQDLRSQLAEYVAQQPASKQTFHKWMGILEMASLAIPVGVFAIALYLSFSWKSRPDPCDPAAWLCFPLSFTPFLILVGLHAVGLRAFPPNGADVAHSSSSCRAYPPPPVDWARELLFRVGRPGGSLGLGHRSCRLDRRGVLGRVRLGRLDRQHAADLRSHPSPWHAARRRHRRSRSPCRSSRSCLGLD